MAANDQEIEAKFLILTPHKLILKLHDLGAQLTAARVKETNLRFDSADGRLIRERVVLRLRQDEHAVLTYKGPAEADRSVSVRPEIEVHVDDFAAARRLLEGLGYHVAVIYEKWRTTYRLDDVLVTVDELPYGNFSEIEGPDETSIRAAASKLGLDWDARSNDSYLGLFFRVQEKKKLAARNLTFEELAGQRFTPADLGLHPADETLKPA